MQNEIILVASIFAFFGGLVAFFRFFGKQGIFAWTVICTIAANIEVLILVHAFGLDTTLGNVIFASTFLATDIMSEIFGKNPRKRHVHPDFAELVPVHPRRGRHDGRTHTHRVR